MTVFGLLNLNKPAGPTSHDIVARVRRAVGIKKVGHAGTLDPLAAGVLVVCVGPATRLSEYVMAGRKVYRARVQFGVETDTYDAQGAVVAQHDVDLSREQVAGALDAFRGAIEQVPPMYSAIKRGGKKLYELARTGEDVAREARAVTIYRLDFAAWEPPFAELEVECSPGTYIRSLAHDLGRALGPGAHLAALARTASGDFTLDEAVTWDEFTATVEAGTWQNLLLPPDRALVNFPALYLDAEQAQQVCNGIWLRMEEAAEASADTLCRAYDASGRFFAVLERRGVKWKPHKVFNV
jgi:tRNA pseudouridine55 synthase